MSEILGINNLARRWAFFTGRLYFVSFLLPDDCWMVLCMCRLKAGRLFSFAENLCAMLSICQPGVFLRPSFVTKRSLIYVQQVGAIRSLYVEKSLPKLDIKLNEASSYNARTCKYVPKYIFKAVKEK